MWARSRSRAKWFLTSLRYPNLAVWPPPRLPPQVKQPRLSDIVTLMVSPDDANTLVYLIYSGAKITLTLRNPNSPGPAVQTDAAMLEYLLTQYNIPVPAKLPYTVQPRIDALVDPKLPGDVATPVP
jgi:hypothetical protein